MACPAVGIGCVPLEPGQVLSVIGIGGGAILRARRGRSFAMNRLKLALAGVAASGAALVTAPEPAKADHYGYAHHWMSNRFQRANNPGFQRPVMAQRPVIRPLRKVVVEHRPRYPAYVRRPAVHRVVYRPAYHPRRVVRVVHRPYPVAYQRSVVRRVHVVDRPFFVDRERFAGRRCFLPEAYLCR